ncbi:FORKHEAD protein, partial [Teratosphaeria destructans]
HERLRGGTLIHVSAAQLELRSSAAAVEGVVVTVSCGREGGCVYGISARGGLIRPRKDITAADLPTHRVHSHTTTTTTTTTTTASYCHQHPGSQDAACCSHPSPSTTPRSGLPTLRLPTCSPATVEPAPARDSDAAASPPERPQEMESSGPGALAVQAAPSSTHPHTPEPLFRVTESTHNDSLDADEPALDGFTLDNDHHDEQHPMASLSTPLHHPTTNHFDPSHVRETVEPPQQSSPTSTDAAHILANPEFRRPSGVDPFAAVPDDPWGATGAHHDVGAAALETFAFPPGDLDHAVAESLAATEYEDGEFAVEDEPLDEHPDMQAFAKLVFADGDYFVTTTTVGLGRDMEFEKSWKRKRKLERAWERHSQQAARAFETGDGGSEVGQPEGGEADKFDPSSKDSHSLEGRPAKGLPSNYSEQGGVVSYAGYSDDDFGTKKARRRRRHLYSKASSDTTSIAPANLHTNTMWPSLVDGETGANPGLTRAFIPVHPVAGREDDIKKVSKEHVIISYNFDEERWEAEIKGKYCWVNDTNYARGDIVPLGHHTRFEFVGIFFNFKLPDQERASPGPSRGTFSEYGGVEDGDEDDDDEEDNDDLLATSPAARKLSGAIDLDSSDDDTPLAAAKFEKKPTKIKLKLKNPLAERKREEAEAKKAKEEKKAARLAAKQQRKEEKRKAKDAREAASLSPEAARKGKKPKEASKQSAKTPAKQPTGSGLAPEMVSADKTEMPTVDAADGAVAVPLSAAVKQEDGKPAKEKASPPAPPPIIIEAGSVLEGVAAEAMPERRKGPGRPPKNGLISKRDQAFIRRKTKEFEKMGREVPPLNVLLDIVRAENKAREAAQKAAARGEVPPPESAIVQSIEMDPATMMMGNQPPKQEPLPSASVEGVTPIGGDQRASATPMNQMPRPPSPKPKRIVKSPSPMKPESAFTEDELKKPSATYVVILDEILRAHPHGQADLQEIYDLICKRYPYFKYRSGTNGWQSSVRHNLLQNERFKENGRSGKGKLWAINHEIPLEREKKRRLTPPPRPPMPNGQPYAQYPPYGNPNYQYGPPGSNPQGQQYGNTQGGPGSYYSPYGQGQPGYGPPHGQQQSSGYGQPAGGGSSGAGQPSQQTSAPPPKAAGEFQTIVDEIMAYRAQYLAGAQGEELDRKTNVFQKCINITSDVFHGQNKEAAKPEGPAEIEVCTALDKIFERHGNLKPAARQSVTPATDASQQTQQTSNPSTSQTASAAPSVGATGNPPPASHASNATGHSAAPPPQQGVTGPGGNVSQPAYPPQASSGATPASGQQLQPGAYPQMGQTNAYAQQPSGSQAAPAVPATMPQAPPSGTQQQSGAPPAQPQSSADGRWPPSSQQNPPQQAPQQAPHAPPSNAAAPTPQPIGQPSPPATAGAQYQRPAWPSTQYPAAQPQHNGTSTSQPQTAAQPPVQSLPKPYVVPNYRYTPPFGIKPLQQAGNSVASSQQSVTPQSQARHLYSNAPSQPPSAPAAPQVSQSGPGVPPSAAEPGPGPHVQYSGASAANGATTAQAGNSAQQVCVQANGNHTSAPAPVPVPDSQPPVNPAQSKPAGDSVEVPSQSAASSVPASAATTNSLVAAPPTEPVQNGPSIASRMQLSNETSAPSPLPPQVAPTPSPALTPVQQNATPVSPHSGSKQGTPAIGETVASPKKRAADDDGSEVEAKRLKTDQVDGTNDDRNVIA